jgi:anti-sigma factor RsiW
MCSNAADRLARLGEAIDRLAAQAASLADATPAEVAERLAALWAMVAELDPGLAGRLRGYTDEVPGGRVRDTPGPGTR